MVKKGGVGKRATGGSSNTKGSHKQKLRTGFETRHLDQVWDDVRSTVTIITTDADGLRIGPVGTTAKAILDEDTPGGGRHYCTPCSKYFISALALEKHTQAKPHKRRVGKVVGDRAPRPHRQADADTAAGMGAPDNGDAGRRRAAAAARAAGGPEAVAGAVEGGLAGMAL